ncbi:DAK2 domain-containing protein, partial [Enterococcus faecalis]
PVPDSDTGSNMLATLSSAYEEAQKADASDVRAVTAALAAGAVRGARGNSGTVLSQVFRAVAEAASGSGIGVESVQHSLKLAVQHVSQAIANP